MGKKGPCFHCEIEYTPLWRNGPPEKPVLCNACGSRWRIWGNLDNYIPKHKHEFSSSKIKNQRNSHKLKRNWPKIAKRKLISTNVKLEEKDNRSSESGSATMIVDNCNIDEGIWNQSIPRRKRSVLNQYTISSTERLRRQLFKMLQDPEFSKLSEDHDELIFIPDRGLSSNEIGLGCMRLQSNLSS